MPLGSRIMKFEALQRIVTSNVRRRGVSDLCRAEFLENATQLFIKASRILIVTGFYIKKASASETDGPPGAVALGCAAVRAGKTVTLLSDSKNYPCLAACSKSVNGPAVISVDDYEKIPAGIDLLVYVERPGHAADGRYYDMKGNDISDVTTPLDKAAEVFLKRGVPVLGIGDGGNEAGMGLLYDALSAKLPNYAPCLSRVGATVCLPVGVSNWGAYALTASLSVFYRQWLGLDCGEEETMLSAMLDAGAVDGITGCSDRSVDGIPLSKLNETILEIKNWYSEGFEI